MARSTASAQGRAVAPLKRVGMGEQAYEALREMLIDRGPEAGDRLNVDKLVDQFGVSQTPIREALARLEAEGLVVKQAMRGYFIAPGLDLAGVQQLFEMRLIVEPAAVGLAATHRTQADLKVMRNSLSDLRNASVGARYRDFAAHANADAAFHDAIARASANPFLQDAIFRLRSHQHLSRFYVGGLASPESDRTLIEHRRILKAVVSGDSAEATDAMRDHLGHACAVMMAQLRPD